MHRPQNNEAELQEVIWAMHAYQFIRLDETNKRLGETGSRPLLQAKEDHFSYCTCRLKMRFALARCKNKKNQRRIRARYGHSCVHGLHSSEGKQCYQILAFDLMKVMKVMKMKMMR